jgi:hypothetical protein
LRQDFDSKSTSRGSIACGNSFGGIESIYVRGYEALATSVRQRRALCTRLHIYGINRISIYAVKMLLRRKELRYYFLLSLHVLINIQNERGHHFIFTIFWGYRATHPFFLRLRCIAPVIFELGITRNVLRMGGGYTAK